MSSPPEDRDSEARIAPAEELAPTEELARAPESEPGPKPPASAPKADAKRRRRLSGWLIDVALFGALLWALGAWQGRGLARSSTRASPFELTAVGRSEQRVVRPRAQGARDTVTLASFSGKSVLVHFWATWCGVCRQEFSTLNALYRGLDEDQALVTIVDDAEDEERLQRFIEEHDLEYPVLLGTPEVRRAYGVRAFPTNYIVRPDGKVSSTTVGLSTRIGLMLRLYWAEVRSGGK